MIAAAGIASDEAFGLADLRLEIVVAGIVSAEDFGLPVVAGVGDHLIEAAGIESAEAFGQPTVAGESLGVPLPSGPLPLIFPKKKPAHSIGGAGRIRSAEAFGRPTVSVRLRAGSAAQTSAQFGAVGVSYRPTMAQLMDEHQLLMS